MQRGKSSKQKKLVSENHWLAPGTALSASVPTTSRKGRVTDHRINLTLYRLDEMMDGSCQIIIDPLVQEYQAELLAGLDTVA